MINWKEAARAFRGQRNWWWRANRDLSEQYEKFCSEHSRIRLERDQLLNILLPQWLTAWGVECRDMCACLTCKGKKTIDVNYDHWDSPFGYVTINEQCHTCKGTGWK